MSASSNENPKITLPPISAISSNMPLLNIDMGNNENPPNQDEEVGSPVTTTKDGGKTRPATFSTSEDISILRTMKMYFGNQVNRKIPWSFWQLYRRMTGSTRSDSSLYHHWNGSMMKKYGGFLREGRLDDCIYWAESTYQLESKRAPPEQNSSRPLFHARSFQSMPVQIFYKPDDSKSPRGLMHFSSQIDRHNWPK